VKSIEFEKSLFVEKFRVIAGPRDRPRILFSTYTYESAERFVWSFRGDEIELRIEKVWIRE
jgi:hypothetical protein